MDRITRRILVSFTVLMLPTSAVLYAAGGPHGAEKSARRPNLLIIGASSLNAPVGQTQLVGAMLESKGIHMNIEGKYPELDAVSQMLSSKKTWDYVIMDSWHFGRGRTDSPEFPKAVAAFVKQVRAHSPKCKIILFPWWLPGQKATNEDVMEVFRRCVKQARLNKIWVATTGPAFMEARLERPDLRVTKSKTDAHPGIHGAYINACSLFIMITGQSPVGLPATLRIKADGERGWIIPSHRKTQSICKSLPGRFTSARSKAPNRRSKNTLSYRARLKPWVVPVAERTAREYN